MKLTLMSNVEYDFDGTRIYAWRPGKEEEPPYALNAKRNFPSVWMKTDKGWLLRTVGKPTTVTKLLAYYGDLAKVISKEENGMDWRIFIVQSACEAAPSRKHPSGKDPLSPRTELGYPNRTGENDTGDPLRDVKDGGKRCSFGLCQTLLSTARQCKPNLFKGVPLEQHRFVLGEPRNSFSCLAGYYWTLPESTRKDPLRVRAAFGAGGVYPSTKNEWGVRLYDRSVMDHWMAFWNDLAEVI